MTWFVAVVSGVLGLAVGSFLNVVIHRVPTKESIVRPRSRCPRCGTELAARDNIPVVSWILLRGKCRSCGAPISGRYPLVELFTAAVFAATGIRFSDSWALPAYLLFFAALIAISFIDLEHYIVPNRIVYPTLFASIPLLVAAALADGQPDRIWHAAVGSLAAWGALLVVHLIQPRGMGFGDVRLSALLGMYLGWIDLELVLLGMLLGFLLGAVVGIGLVVTKVRGRKDAVPFAPFLAAGATIAILASRPLLSWYGA
ncbi:MAG: leader peptidase (prepilin peptidase) / N-methyltransferase [Actinomycetota bacterium]|jgi:leader peptidase (prepilin peptidase)/N-methyltransferase